MLFTAPEFICLFLPITLIFFFLLGKISNRLAILLLLVASLFFYAWWKLEYLFLLLCSLILNYLLGTLLGCEKLLWKKKFYLGLGLAVNLGLLGYFKYLNFFLESTNYLFNLSLPVQSIALPLAISFFTFQQIAYLVDAYSNKVKDYSLLNYCLFVSFFPQLIAGPIVRCQDILPQFHEEKTYQFDIEDFAIGLTIFSFGLFKKIVIADSLAVYVNPVFDWGGDPTFFEAWGGALCYTFQLYFDFSGYSDMAIGLARMFRIKLPANFNSPYKAFCIIDFWRRWHITLSNFLKDYLYIPLGGNRNGVFRRDFNLMTTMVLGGLWHGAGWTFVLWGGLHGIYLVGNNYWHSFLRKLGHPPESPKGFAKIIGIVVTFNLIVIGWVLFRADSLSTARSILKGMAGLNGIMIPQMLASNLGPIQSLLAALGIRFPHLSPQAVHGFIAPLIWATVLLPSVWFLPNTQEWLLSFKPVLEAPEAPITEEQTNQPQSAQRSQSELKSLGCMLRVPDWQLDLRHGVIIGCILFITFKWVFSIPKTNFLYFNF